MSRTVRVAAGVFAPGHLGALTRYVPFELVDAVLEETRTRERRLRDLPSRVGVYFLLGLGLFSGIGYLRVWAKLVAGLDDLAVPRASEKALRDLRRRLGPAPMKALFDALAGPIAGPRTPGVTYRGLRTVAIDGCNSLKVPETEANRTWLGLRRNPNGWAGYPTLRLVALVETGTRGLLAAAIGSSRSGELTRARSTTPGP
ncbi:transposase domain-containing protein [Embleya scabrispora]|uniref:transposase domain-containing protein n=1 Tax=Embleya scabrispora TaxID=159449 RepID=UPI001FE03D28|nr:transposase domain-containing protein [Embleya scabrispora]